MNPNPTLTRVREFHRAFGHPVEHTLTIPDEATRLLRFRLLLEEVYEFGRAAGISPFCDMDQQTFDSWINAEARQAYRAAGPEKVNLVECADALGDIDYVCQGANLCFGFPAEAVVAEIHRANMSKLGPDGQPIKDPSGRVVKSPNYTPPDIKLLLEFFAKNGS